MIRSSRLSASAARPAFIHLSPAERTARNAAHPLRTHGATRVIAVSQFFHIARLRWLLAAEGVQVVGHSHARYHEWRDLYSSARETIALLRLLALHVLTKMAVAMN